MFSLLAEDKVSQTEGAVLLYKMDSPPFHSLDVAFLESLANSLQLRFKAVHLLSTKRILNDVESRINFADEIYVHVSSSNHELASQLEESGMYKAGLPKYLNGKWGLSEYLYWSELRTRTEWRIPLGFSWRDYLSMCNDFLAIKPYTVLPDEEKAERNRRMNVIHCRRKRNQRRVELDDLAEECADLRKTREDLLKEHRRLEDLVRVAIETVERVEGEQCDTANQSGRLSAQTAEHCSSSSSGDTIPVHPVLTGYEQASTGNAASASSMGQPNPPL
jgi:hypothetical protein